MPTITGGAVSALLVLLVLRVLSTERDQWVRVAGARERSACERGYRVGHGAGYRAGYGRAVLDWKVVAEVASGPSYTELDRRRYPPGGRRSWIVPRPGEHAGRQR